METTKKVVTFGEIMARISMPGFQRFAQSLPGTVDFTFAGAEANVAVSLALFGLPVEFVTALPKNPLTEACLAKLRSLSVGVTHILKAKQGRLGAYYVETGANQRPSTVVYDRDYSSIALAKPEDYDWDAVFSGVSWFHISGITPALSKNAADTAEYAVKRAKAAGASVSFDLNFRKKLWNWDAQKAPRELARETAARIMPYVDVVIGNEEDADDVLGIKAGTTDVTSGKLDLEKYPDVARQIVKKFPQLRYAAFTLRESISATHNNWGAMLYDVKADKAVFAPETDGVYRPYEIRNIVDRIGGGDSFSAALIYALIDRDLSSTGLRALSFAAAASCLCHSVYGDFNFIKKEEAITLMEGNASGRVSR